MADDRPPRGRARGRSRGHFPEGEVGYRPEFQPEGHLQDPRQDAQELMCGIGMEEENRRGGGPIRGDERERVVPARGFRREQPDFLHSRPKELVNKKGNAGTPKLLVANYFEFQTKRLNPMRLYTVSFTPEIDEVKIRKALLKQKEENVGPYLFDGTQLFTTSDVAPEFQEFEVKFPDKPEIYAVKITFMRIVSSLEPLAFQLYNLFVKKCQILLDLDLLGRYYFDRNQKVSDGQLRIHKLEMWPGYITSMRQQETSVLLNVDITFKVIRTDSVFHLMRELRHHYQHDYEAKCEEAIIGTIVMTGYNRKTYRVDKIDWQRRATDTFMKGKGSKATPISFIDYFKEKHKTRIEFEKQPMLISHPKARDIRQGNTEDILLVPELCYQTGLNEDLRSNFRLMKDMSNHLHMSPQRRLTAIKQFMARIQSTTKFKDEIFRWGSRLLPEMAKVEGRQLPPEQVIFQQGGVPPNEFGDWSMAFRNQKMFTSKLLKIWVIICPANDAGNVDNLIQTMLRVATPLGFQISRPVDIIRLSQPNSLYYKSAISDTLGKLKGKVDLIMCILPNNRLDLYAEIKKTCAIEYGVPSQCFLAKNLTNKGLMSICTKLVIQVNAKLGGEPWSINNPLKGLMVVGFDVHHGGGKSVGAMVASMTPTLAKYYSTICHQEAGMEMSAGVGAALQRCILAFAKHNQGELPARIMFYRDGVGEGQLIYINETELKGCKGIIKNLYSSQGKELPKFTFIIVTKRTNARLFDISNREEAKNVGPGTIVDDGITCPERYDFYLVPHSVRQGTISPINFNVLMDTSGLDADKIQRFTYKLCYMYFNWSGTVACPSPCQYAHKLAFLTGTALQREAHEHLSNLLHFL